MGRRRMRVCRSCGKGLPPTCLWLCESCQALGAGTWLRAKNRDCLEILEVAKEREALGVFPIYDMGLEEVAALAKCYRPPYNTYGKLRAYVEQMRRLPPVEFERSKDEIF